MDSSKQSASFFMSPKTMFPVFFFIGFSFLWSACNEKKEVGIEIGNADTLPRMTTYCVTSLISDSGVIRYRIVTDEWLVFDKAQNPYWYFPQGLYVEQFDLLLNPDAHIRCDTAYFYEKKKLWHLIGDVHMENLQQEKFDTRELFWDQNKEKVYSDKFIRIEQKELILEGIGFDSNQSMTKYTIRRPQGIFPIENDINTDSVDENATEPAAPFPKNDSIPSINGRKE